MQVQEIETKCYLYKGTFWKYNGNGISWLVTDKTEQSGSYESIMERLYLNVTWKFEQDNDYQGNWYGAGYDEEDNWYFIQGSFGSCSGCDWLYGLSGREDMISFLHQHDKDTIVKPSKQELIDYMDNTSKNVSWSRPTLETLLEKLRAQA